MRSDFNQILAVVEQDETRSANKERNSMGWLLLAAAIIFEVLGTTSMKLSEGFTNLVPTIMIVVFYALSFTLLTLVLKQIDISVAYALWAGLGTALVATIGVLIFEEPLTGIKALALVLIVIGVVMLNLAEIH